MRFFCDDEKDGGRFPLSKKNQRKSADKKQTKTHTKNNAQKPLSTSPLQSKKTKKRGTHTL